MGDDSAKVKIIHFADPFCFWSWGLEPVLQRLRTVYGHNLEVVYRMGGVFDDFRDWQKKYGVDDDSTVTWTAKAGKVSGNPTKPDYLVCSGLQTSYPACRAVKAAERQDARKVERYFRRLMEVFQIEAQEPTDEVLLGAAEDVGLDRDRIAADMATGDIDEAFAADREAMQAMRASFLTLVVACGDERGGFNGEFSSARYEKLIDKMAPGLPKQKPTNILEYLAPLRGHLVHTREVAEVFGIRDGEADRRLRKLHDAGMVGERVYDFGRYWEPKAQPAAGDPPDAALVG